MSVAPRLVAAVAVSALLAACGNDGGGNPAVAAIGQMAKSAVAKGRNGAAGPGPTAQAPGRAELEAYGKPVLRVKSPTLGQDALLTIADSKADVVTWTAQGQANFSLRNGVLIQTRGLGADLMSAEAPALAQLKGGASYQRIYYFLGPDDAGTRRTYDCAAVVVGAETVEILGKSHGATHVTETCTRPNGKVTNDYWIEGGTVRKSRQWASSAVGYLEFEKVID
ncbi:MAG: YjbF family lipoprotein [Tabrizicola sp.]